MASTMPAECRTGERPPAARTAGHRNWPEPATARPQPWLCREIASECTANNTVASVSALIAPEVLTGRASMMHTTMIKASLRNCKENPAKQKKPSRAVSRLPAHRSWGFPSAAAGAASDSDSSLRAVRVGHEAPPQGGPHTTARRNAAGSASAWGSMCVRQPAPGARTRGRRPEAQSATAACGARRSMRFSNLVSQRGEPARPGPVRLRR